MSEEQSLSVQLRSAREQRGTSIEDIQRRTGLSANVLRGLESDRFDVVEAVFTRMTLRDYAAHLGLDVDALLAQYDREAGRFVKPVRKPPIPLPPPPAKGARSPLDTATLRWIGLAAAALIMLFLIYLFFIHEPDPPRSGFTPSDPPLSGAYEGRSTPAPTPPRDQRTIASRSTAPDEQTLTVAAGSQPPSGESAANPSAAAAVPQTAPPTAPDTADREEASPIDAGETAALSAIPESRGTSPATPGDAASAAVANTGEMVLPAATGAPVPKTSDASASPIRSTPAAADSLLSLEVEAVDDTWVEITGDSRVLFQGILPQGERRRWTTGEVFHVHSGRAHGLRYWFQDRLLSNGRLGDPTQVLRFRASRTGVTLLDADLQPLEELSPGPDQQP